MLQKKLEKIAKKEACFRKIKEETNQTHKNLESYLFRPQLQQNSRFLNIHNGERCFIVGNGPSLKKQNLSLLSDEIVFTVNTIYNSPQFKTLNANYHFLFDDGFFSSLEKLMSNLEPLSFGGECPKVFLSYEASYAMLSELEKDEKYDISFLSSHHSINENCLKKDITKSITGFSTVVQYAIIVAIYMGCKEIYLLGCDCTGIIENINIAQNILQSEHGFDLTVDILEDYHALETKTDYWDSVFSGWAEMFLGYKKLNDDAASNGVKIFNATEGGILKTFPCTTLNSLFVNNKKVAEHE